MSLTEFLLARIAEDEATAKGAYRDSVDDRGICHADWKPAATAVMWGDTVMVDGLEADYLAEHIARHDPARVLAECEAKRRIVELVVDAVDDQGGVNADSGGVFAAAYDHVCQVLAAVYADHPDYREEWKP